MHDEYAIELEDIRGQIRRGRYTVCFTHTEKIRLRRMGIQEIEDAILNGTIIEPYPDDPRGASCLIITAYEPGEDEWEADLRTRK